VTVDTSSHILWLLRRAHDRGRRTVNDAIAGYGVTTAQLGVLNRLADQPGLSGAELARRSLITSQAAQLALAGLERRGLVVRKADPNHARILQAFLTEEGRRLVDECLTDAVRGEEELLSVLTDQEQRTLASLLGKLVRAPA
jgi:DNA-binding MarR family transcriptional regulator